MAYNDMSPLSATPNEKLDQVHCTWEDLTDEIKLFRKALRYCKSQDGDDNCWMDYRHLLMRFLPGYNPETDDVRLDVDQEKNCTSFRKCFQENGLWQCLGGDKGKSVRARTIGTLDCLTEISDEG
jgi:hypothetical protein